MMMVIVMTMAAEVILKTITITMTMTTMTATMMIIFENNIRFYSRVEPNTSWGFAKNAGAHGNTITSTENINRAPVNVA